MNRLILKHFDDIQFLWWDHVPEYSDWNDKIFEDYYGLQFNYSGQLRYSIDNARMRNVEGPHAWLTIPNHHYIYGSPDGTHRNHRWIIFTGKRLDRWREAGLLPQYISEPTVITQPDLFANDMDRMFKNLGKGEIPPAANLLESLLIQIHYQPPAAGSDYLTPAIRELAKQITSNPGNPWDLHEEAQKLGISHAHFRRIFKKTVSTSCAKFVQQNRLQLAAQLLRTSQDPIASIADTVGISDIYYFTRLFCQKYQMPPARYRKHLNQLANNATKS